MLHRSEALSLSIDPERKISVPKAQAAPGKKLLSPADHTLIMIDHQSQMSFATKSIDATLLRNNCALVAKAHP